MKSNTGEMFKYIYSEYYDSNPDRFGKETGYSKPTYGPWITGQRQPRRKTIEYLLSLIFHPEFQVITEFHPLSPGTPLRSQIDRALHSHKNSPGLYAFYDDLANLLYLGKAKSLAREISAALNREDKISFPAGIADKLFKRQSLVGYFSAYHVKQLGKQDYAKHVESLILRISKPPINKNIGRLQPAHISKPEE